MDYVYILQSCKNFQLYIGRTEDLKRRLQEHAKGKVKTTNRLNPMKLVFTEVFLSKKDATRREKYFKTSKGKSTLRQTLRNSLLNK